MSVPTKRIAIVGRPNVGKSTLFNLLTESRKAVVKNRPGVTRDIQVENAEIWGRSFEVLDTGGVTDSQEGFSPQIKAQVEAIIHRVDLLLVVVDGKYGLCPEDRDIVQMAKRSEKDFVIIVNKVDRPQESDLAKSEFYELGADLVDTSFEQRHGLGELFEWIYERIDVEADIAEKRGVSLAIVGKPNVGKSSLCNFLLGENRMLVSDIAGTTVDAIDAELEFEGTRYILTDTAGLRKSARRVDDVEVISAFKSHDAIDRSDLVLLMIDGMTGPTEQDAKILNYVLEKHKGVLLVVNKTDLGEKEKEAFRKTTRELVSREFHFFVDLPMCFISAKTGAGVGKMFAQVDDIWRKLHHRVSTSDLNDFFTSVIRQAPAPVHGTKNVKFYYLTQTKQVPPSFIAFANYPESVTDSYRRFLAKRIQERWQLKGIPVRIFAMKSRSH